MPQPELVILHELLGLRVCEVLLELPILLERTRAALLLDQMAPQRVADLIVDDRDLDEALACDGARGRIEVAEAAQLVDGDVAGDADAVPVRLPALADKLGDIVAGVEYGIEMRIDGIQLLGRFVVCLGLLLLLQHGLWRARERR